VRELQAEIGGAYRHPLTGIPHSRFERWIGERTDVDRCRIGFRDSIYGARPYNQPWLFPFTGRIILIADSIRVHGRLIGVDKINHFIREGLSHWKAAGEPGGNIATVMRNELGSPGRQFRWNEYGLKGWSLTGVLAYSDLAASYSGYRFWSDPFVDRPASIAGRARRDIGKLCPAAAVHVRGLCERCLGREHQLFSVPAGARKTSRIRASEADDDVSCGGCVFTVGSARRPALRQSEAVERRHQVARPYLSSPVVTCRYLLGPL
jgi:hypothetical protein